MARDFRIISQKWYNELINDDGTGNFVINPTVFNKEMTGNQGELVKVVREIELSVTVNELQNVSMRYDATTDPTYGTLTADSLNFQTEGLFDGATVDVIFNKGKLTVSGVAIDTISGRNNSVLRIDKTSLTALKDGETRTDIVLRLTTAPTYLTYKYGTIDVDAKAVNFQSQIDGSEQAYYIQSIPTSPTTGTMRLIGNDTGSDLTQELTITFDRTANSYYHQYTLEHVFRIPYYTEGEFGNLVTGTIPRRNRPVNMKYCSGFYFGGTTAVTTIRFEDLGGISNVGYFNENFRGRQNFYTVENYAVSNSLNTERIEASVTNTITFTIVSATATGFVGGEEFILTHSKLPSDNDSQYKTDSFDDVWLFDSVRVTEGAAAVSSTRWSNVSATIRSGTEIDVTADLAFSTDDQDKLSDIDVGLVYATIATQNKGNAETVDKSNIVIGAKRYSKNPDIEGIITQHQPTIYPESEFNGGTGYTNFDGYNGDLMGYENTFTVDLESNPLITGVEFMIVMDDGTEYFPLYSLSIPITNVQTVNVSGDQRQIYNLDIPNDFNLPQDELLNRIQLEALNPGSAGATQDWSVSLGFQTPWREWIANYNVPTDFIDYAEENNNQNNRTSNYSGVSGFETKALLRVQTQVNDNVNQTSVTTFYELFSDGSATLDFNDPGVGSFSYTLDAYDANGDPTSNLFTTSDVQLDNTFAHSLGTLLTANLFGYVWILPKNGIGQPWFLSTDLDLTDPLNPLQATNIVTSSNTQFVEVVSTLNEVILRCRTNKDNLSLNQDYIIYARLYPK